MYHKITNPITNRKVSIHSILGRKIIQYYINELKMKGGNYPGHCDGNPSQCMDSTSGANCSGGGKKKKMKGGNYPGHCDGNPSQCMDSTSGANCSGGGKKKSLN